MRESMLRHTMHVGIASNTYTIHYFDYFKRRCLLWRDVTSHILLWTNVNLDGLKTECWCQFITLNETKWYKKCNCFTTIRNVSIGHRCPYKMHAEHRILLTPMCDLDLILMDVKIPRCTSSSGKKCLVIKLYGSSTFEFMQWYKFGAIDILIRTSISPSGGEKKYSQHNLTSVKDITRHRYYQVLGYFLSWISPHYSCSTE